jgi:curved DNA-binding protein CbpA
MESDLRGQLGDKPIAIVLREIAHRRLSGSLLLTLNRVTKSIVFDEGVPVFASSSLANEQLDHKLTTGRLAAVGLVEAAKKRNPTPQSLGRTLVDSGVISRQIMEQKVSELSEEIIHSVFEWDKGEFAFEETSEVDCDTRLNWNAADCLLNAARQAARVDSIANSIAPDDRKIKQSLDNNNPIASGAVLSSAEAYVLSTIVSPTSISDISNLTGLPDSEARSAVCVLLTIGLLTFVEEQQPSQPINNSNSNGHSERVTTSAEAVEGNNKYSRVSVEWVIELASRKLISIKSADYYEILGVERIATTGKIDTAYAELKGMFASFRSRWPNHRDLNAKLEELLSEITKAHATLSDPQRRRVYDMPRDLPTPPRAPQVERGGFDSLPKPRRPVPSPPIAVPIPVDSKKSLELDATRPPIPSTPRPVIVNTAKAAEEQYRRGRAHFDRRDFHTAAHLFREAIKLDASLAHAHFQLGITLSILSQARHEHSHDEGCHVTCTLGDSLLRNQRARREAEQHLLKAAELDRTNPEIRLRLALLYKDAGMEKKAEQYFHETLLLDGGNARALRELGIGDETKVRIKSKE